MAALVIAPPAIAANRVDFDPGNIISDVVFFDGNSMAAGDIQTFLNSKVTTCSSTAPMPCLKSYAGPSSNRAADRYCAGYEGSASESAAAIIAKVAVSCKINPKVILTTLQKEQALVTSSSPSAYAYRSAMGYGCPDTAACDAQYYGFFNQVYSAARQFQVYTLNPTIWRYQAGRAVDILYSPVQSCPGSSSVLIKNQATANLYIYTPYQPNEAALANLYGTGDSCSSYGNRNFWRTFTDWFGSPLLKTGTVPFIRAAYQDLLGRTGGQEEVDFWSRLTSRGWTRLSIASAFLNSYEYRANSVRAAYTTYLGRSPVQYEVDYWLSQYGTSIFGNDELQYYFSISPEFYAKYNSDPATLIAGLYREMLGREARADDVTYWTSQMQQFGRQNVVFSIWESDEAHTHRISVAYQQFLGRPAGPTDLAYWIPVTRLGSDYDLMYGIVWSPEYFDYAGRRFIA